MDGMTGRAIGELSAPAFPCSFHRHPAPEPALGKLQEVIRSCVIIPCWSQALAVLLRSS